jgi:indole-3-glycerol phosphate synthase/phosphoribosylanthranilate isomerase
MTEPSGVLVEIARAKRAELAARYDGVVLDALRADARPTARSLRDAIARPGARFVFEIKKASPSEGAIRASADAAAIAGGYSGVADALSVLCDRGFFGGSLDDLAAARTEFAGPILAKDFFIDLRQVAEARIAGADAILVMLSLLDDQAARAMIEEARRFGMDALVEVHDEAEMRRALALDAPLVGINNRDLRDLSVDLSTTERLAPLALGRTLISESGIARRNDVERLAGQVDGFLVGSALMRAPSPAEASRALAFGRVKLCGMRSVADVTAARAATHLGFVFVPGTPRYLNPDKARPLIAKARANGHKVVGVFRDCGPKQISKVAHDLSLDAAQVHGSCGALSLPEFCEHWCAVDASRDINDHGCDRLVFDNGVGGSGETFDWTRVMEHPRLAESLLAGGIGPANARAAASLGAYAIDVGSSVDVAPGVKSAERIEALFETLRPVGRKELAECA